MILLLALIPAGLLAGWLINYLADVLPSKQNVTRPLCARCGAPQSWNEYLAFKPCHSCQKKPQLRRFIFPALFSVLIAWVWFSPPVHFDTWTIKNVPAYLDFWVSAVLLAIFSLVIIIDIEHHLILHKVNLVGLLVGLTIGLLRHDWQTTLLGGAGGLVAMLAFYLLGIAYSRFVLKPRGQVIEDDEALGFGDVYLTGWLGLLLGWPAIVAGVSVGLVSSAVVGGLILLVSVLRKQKLGDTFIPLGPFLVFGAMFVLFPPW